MSWFFSDLYRFSPTGLMPPHPGLSPHAHALASHALVSSAPKADHSTLDHNHRFVMTLNFVSLATSEQLAAKPASIIPVLFPDILCPSTRLDKLCGIYHEVHLNYGIAVDRKSIEIFKAMTTSDPVYINALNTINYHDDYYTFDIQEKKKEEETCRKKRCHNLWNDAAIKLSKTINELADLSLGTVLSLPALVISLINYSAAGL